MQIDLAACRNDDIAHTEACKVVRISPRTGPRIRSASSIALSSSERSFLSNSSCSRLFKRR